VGGTCGPGAGKRTVTTQEKTGIQRLLHPRSIAIVGISPQPMSPAVAILGNIERLGYAAEVHLVSRNRTEVIGRPCVPTIDDLPLGIDLALLLVPRAGVIDAMHACARRQVGSAIVYASGFAELDDDGRAAQTEIAAIAGAAGIALLGPNCLGFINYLDHLAVTFSPTHPESDPPPPKVAFISQSGGTPSVTRFSLAAKSIGVTYQISTGNEALLGVEDFLGPMIDDERNLVIALFCEQIRNPQRFLAEAARARERGKPIVMLQPGASAAAQASALSHTGSLVGNHALIRTIVEDAGVLAVDTVEDLIDVIELLATFPVVPTQGPALITDSGALKGVELDFCESVGLPVPRFSDAAIAAVRAVVPDFVALENPLDVTAQALVDTQLYAKAIGALASDEATGCTVISPIYGQAEMGIKKLRTIWPAFAAARDTRPAILAPLVYDAPMPEEAFREAAAAGIAFFRSPERALRALARVTRYGVRCAQPPPGPRTLPAPLPIDAPGVVPEYRAKAMLAAAGIVFPRGVFVTDRAGARRAAAEIGYPVALKLQSAGLAHKTDAGALALGVADATALDDAWLRLHANAAVSAPNAAIDGVLIEAMAKPGVEFIAGARRDPQWGTTLVAGLGGIWAEALHDTIVIPAAASEDAIVAALRRLRAAPVLAGMRGAPPLDVQAAARVLASLGALIDATPGISEIELNPLTLYPDGAVALDALIVVA
jgi:acetate---CoA ligase (ADP-forming)